MTTPIPVFDGHNDTLLRLWKTGGDVEDLFLKGSEGGHIDLPRARAGGLAGGFFAMFPPPVGKKGPDADPTTKSYDVPLPPLLSQADAMEATLGMASVLFRIERESDGAFAVCRSAAEIRAAMTQGAMAAVFHIEGAEAIDPDLTALDLLHAAGLRSLGLVWSRPNVFGYGVPFRFPSTPDIGPGLTDAGKALVKACNELNILVDLSHLNEIGFRDVAATSDAPLVATHSNAYSVCPHSRNLTDWQLAAIRDSGGIVGLNFACGFLRPDGQMKADTSIDVMVRHLDALLEALGEDGVALGSDFDGAVVPKPIGDAAGLPKLLEALAAKGYGAELVEKIASRNWLSIIERTIG
ncbi:MAG: dipeptidase [Rhizobiaceae bacterium]|nr:dipeptidase [Rhizobiaceae bacterium]